MGNRMQHLNQGGPREELTAVIEAGMKQLPEPERTVLILADMHGLSYVEIAHRTGASVENVGARLSRGRLRLRDYMLKHQANLSAQYRFAPNSRRGIKSEETIGHNHLKRPSVP